MEMVCGAPALHKWFSGSVVVDDVGSPLVLYHGTRSRFETFSKAHLQRASMHSTALAGFFFSSSPVVASMFAGEHWEEGTWPLVRTYANGANVMPVLLSIRNPREIAARDFVERFVRGCSFSREQFQAWARSDHRCDGVLIKSDEHLGEALDGEEYGADTWVAFEPEQIVTAFHPFCQM